MGLPQELVDRIMDILQDDRRTLEACSLTCKSMFASTRHFIHRTLYVTGEIREKMFTPAERQRRARGGCLELELRPLSFMGELDLLKYTRHLNIRVGRGFSPDALEPHLHHFQSLDRVHTLTIYSYHAHVWRNAYNTHFTQFYPTLTTLSLHFPISDYRDILRFALQFPNLENLTIETMRDGRAVLPGASVSPLVNRSPPLRGRLRCADVSPSDPQWTSEFAFSLPGGVNFRSIEFRDVYWGHGQRILDGCAGSLEEFTLRIPRNGEESSTHFFHATNTEDTDSLPGWFELGQFQFQENTSLRSIILRTSFSNLFGSAAASLWTRFLATAPLTLCEFVLELDSPPSEFAQPSPSIWGNWDEIDKLFRASLDQRPDFKLVIRTGVLSDDDEFQARTKDRFPLMVERNRVRFEKSLAVGWSKCPPPSLHARYPENTRTDSTI